MLSKLITSLITVALLITGIYFIPWKSEPSTPELSAQQSPNISKQHELWTIAKLSEVLVEKNAEEFIFMKENSMEGTYVELAEGASYNRTAINDDLYYLHTGTCTVKYDNRSQSFAAGDIIYVKKGSELLIEDSNEALQLVIVSMYLNSNSAKPRWRHFSKKSMVAERSSEENMWNPFIMYSNVMLGLYMLPHRLDRDQRLVHEWQELNIVTSGSSKFVMDSGAIDVEEGSIFFVEEGNGHYFEELGDDLDILILWEMRNVDHSQH